MAGGTAESARLATRYSFFELENSPVGAFLMVGLVKGCQQFRRNEPGLASVLLVPRMNGVPGTTGFGHAFAVVAAVMGVATSLSLNVMQFNGGLNFLFGVPWNTLWQAMILAAMFTASTAAGLDRGINPWPKPTSARRWR